MSKSNTDVNGAHSHQKKISEMLKDLDTLVEWFQSREDLDIEEGLKRVKEGSALVKLLKEKLKKVENEFEEIKKDLDVDNE